MPRPTVDKIGKRFGMLLVIEKQEGIGRTMWLCLCDCGKKTGVRDDFLGRKTNSCGCRRRENSAELGRSRATHGHCRRGKLSGAYRSWRSAWQRCFDPNARGWKNYGGRGITMCPHWVNCFSTFLADMGERPVGMCIERTDNDKGYLCPICCPPNGNCRWANMSDQITNQRHKIFHEERSKRMTSWWMCLSPEYRHERAVAAARARWGG